MKNKKGWRNITEELFNLYRQESCWVFWRTISGLEQRWREINHLRNQFISTLVIVTTMMVVTMNESLFAYIINNTCIYPSTNKEILPPTYVRYKYFFTNKISNSHVYWLFCSWNLESSGHPDIYPSPLVHLRSSCCSNHHNN